MDSDGWTLVQKYQKKKTFARSFLWLINYWITWRIDTDKFLKKLASSSNTAMQFIRQDLEQWVSDEIEFLRIQWSYIEDSDFLTFLRMLMPCYTLVSQTWMSYCDLVDYREKQLVQCRKKMMHNLTCLYKRQKIPQKIAALISRFVPLLILDSETYAQIGLGTKPTPRHWYSWYSSDPTPEHYGVTLDISPTRGYTNYTNWVSDTIDQLEWEETELSKEYE